MEEVNKKQAEPNVHIFGEEIVSGKDHKNHGCCGADKDGHGKHHHKHKRHNWGHGDCCHHHSDSGFGVAILLAGILLLLNTLGTIPWEIWNYIWMFWPVLLVLAGLKIILGRAPGVNILMFLASLAICGFIVVYGLIQVNSPLVNRLPSGIVNFVNNFNLNYLKK